jgi:hypothetical protein
MSRPTPSASSRFPNGALRLSSGVVEAIAGDAGPLALSAKLANSIQQSNALHRTYAPVDIEAVRSTDEARLRGRKGIVRAKYLKNLERVNGIEPSSSAWMKIQVLRIGRCRQTSRRSKSSGNWLCKGDDAFKAAICHSRYRLAFRLGGSRSFHRIDLMVRAPAYVRFGSKADMCDAKSHVRFGLESGQFRRAAEVSVRPKADIKCHSQYSGQSTPSRRQRPGTLQ